MFASLLVCVGLLSQSPPASAPDLAAYEIAKAHAGRDPNAHVKLALWCEAHGLDAERLKHLARAVLIDPKNVAARGMMGLVAHEGRWASPEAVSQQVKGDEALSTKLAQYETRRDEVQKEVARLLNIEAVPARVARYRNFQLESARIGRNSAGPHTREGTRRDEEALQLKKAARIHVQLALWCEMSDLKPEAIAHFTEASQLCPTLITPWEHMGYKKHQGRWMTDERIAAEQREVEAQNHADRSWEPLLRKWKLWLGEDSRRDEAEAHLAKVTDLRAVPSVWRVFVKGGEADKRQALRILERIDSPDATRALIMLAAFGATDDLRGNALRVVRSRDPRDVIPPLIEMIHRPLRYSLEPPSTSEQIRRRSFGTLVVDGEQYNIQRSYYGPSFIYELGVPVAQVPSGMKDQLVRERVSQDIRELEQINETARQVSESALPVLKAITGQDFGEDADLWRTWWAEQTGYVYDAVRPEYKPTSIQNFTLPSPTILPSPPADPIGQRLLATFGRAHDACFGAGTMVETFTGPRRIESLRLGDRVLSQDTRTGALSYQPVVAVHHNPPNETLRIRLSGESIVATGIHRFWKAGDGWIMARDLKAGDFVRIVGGTARIVRVEPDAVQPVYNLNVASNRDFFVANPGLLVHDFGMVEAVPEPFDAPPSLEAH
ncbi:MAG: polymorphic toxin-type HINT domain-containing protein [Isosphaeraceae bacterium]